MNQLGKNLFLVLCIIAMLLVILGLKRKFSGEDAKTLLSQPAEEIKPVAPGPAMGAPRPRVLQAKPVTQHEHAVLSPTNSKYAESETQASPAGGVPIVPVPSLIAPPRSLDAPDFPPLDASMAAPVANSAAAETPAPAPLIETTTVPVAARPLRESVVTDSEDSFWSISERVYGSGAYYRALFRHNEARVLRPDQLRAGIEVQTPPLEVLRELYPADVPQEASLTP